MKNISKMARREFEALPERKWAEDIGEFDSMVILPAEINYISIAKYWIRYFVAKTFKLEKPEIWEIWEIKGLHDSGFRCMDFVACKGEEPICRLSGCSDVILFNGIGGYGYNWVEEYGKIPDLLSPIDWNIDCLPKSGLLRIFCQKYKLKIGEALSSFELFAIKKEAKNG